MIADQQERRGGPKHESGNQELKTGQRPRKALKVGVGSVLSVGEKKQNTLSWKSDGSEEVFGGYIYTLFIHTETNDGL